MVNPNSLESAAFLPIAPFYNNNLIARRAFAYYLGVNNFSLEKEGPARAGRKKTGGLSGAKARPRGAPRGSEPPAGIEPATSRLQITRSAN